MSTGGEQGSHTVLSVLRGAEVWLDRRTVDAPRRSAELLLGKVLGMDRMQLYLAHDRPLDESERAAMRSLLARRGDGEPVAYLLGSWSFRGLDLAVDRAVLIPRPETEELVDHALARLPPGGAVADLGTGSGAIAIAIAVARPDVTVTATDLSRNALAVARANAERHRVAGRVEFACGSWWEAVPAGRMFDLVVTNPPYVDPEHTEGLEPAVAAYEPPLALFTAPGDPASAYRAIAAGLAERLRPGGFLVAETGLGASGPGEAMLRALPFLGEVAVLRDAAGKDRFLVGRRI